MEAVDDLPDPHSEPATEAADDADFLLYGAYGYTGRLVAEAAAAQGLRPLLSGRDPAKLAALAGELGLPHRAVDLADAETLRAVLGTVPVVLHCAGPFAHTWRPMVEACLAARTHYLDVTGEAEVFLACHGLDVRAREAGILLLPGVGFDVVPSDCLAAHLARRLPKATSLRLAFRSSGGLSRGTATTMVENLHRGGLVRRGGELRRVPAAWRTADWELDGKRRTVVTIPWGDVVTSYFSTGIPDVEVYTTAGRQQLFAMRAARHLGWLLRRGPVQSLLKRRVRAAPPGPDEEARRRGRSVLWGEVRDAAGGRATAALRGPEGYTFTAATALAVVGRVLAGQAPAGYHTPSSAYGPDLVLEVPGVERTDDPPGGLT